MMRLLQRLKHQQAMLIDCTAMIACQAWQAFCWQQSSDQCTSMPNGVPEADPQQYAINGTVFC